MGKIQDIQKRLHMYQGFFRDYGYLLEPYTEYNDSGWLTVTVASSYPEVRINVFGDDETQRHLVVRCMRIPSNKKWDKVPDGSTFSLATTLDTGVRVIIVADRESVCKRVVVGTKREYIPAQKATTRDVEIVEWQCEPLLGE